MSYRVIIKFGDDGQPIVGSSDGTLPPAGHSISIRGHYELPNLYQDEVYGYVSLEVDHKDSVGDHVVSAQHMHTRISQGLTQSDAKIVDRLRSAEKARLEAKRASAHVAPDPMRPVEGYL